jgi:hypothetical protein
MITTLPPTKITITNVIAAAAATIVTTTVIATAIETEIPTATVTAIVTVTAIDAAIETETPTAIVTATATATAFRFVSKTCSQIFYLSGIESHCKHTSLLNHSVRVYAVKINSFIYITPNTYNALPIL